MKPAAYFAASLLCLAGVGATGYLRHHAPPATPHEQMVAAAAKLLDSFDKDLRAKCALPFDGKARTDWHFVPRTRPGVRLADMNDAQKSAARALLRSALSTQGVLKVEQIMSLDAVLRELDNNPDRDPLQYTFAVYGTPGDKDPWGWKIEGHHISLNFTCASGKIAGTTPSFYGSDPAEVRSGPRAGVRALAAEEDLGRKLLKSLDDAQRKEAVISDDAPREIITAPGRSLDEAPAAGLAHSKMTPDQRAILDALLEEYAHNLRAELAKAELKRIRDAGIDAVRFAWAGSSEPGQGHYYRITGPTFVIEYDNTQNKANHVHTVWHDRQRDFGQDALKDHYKTEHAPK